MSGLPLHPLLIQSSMIVQHSTSPEVPMNASSPLYFIAVILFPATGVLPNVVCLSAAKVFPSQAIVVMIILLVYGFVSLAPRLFFGLEYVAVFPDMDRHEVLGKVVSG